MTRREMLPHAEVRRIARHIIELQGKVALIEKGQRSTQLARSSIEGGRLTIKDADGIPREYIGMQPDGTSGVRAVNGPPPPRPNTPDMEGIMDGVMIRWNGEFVSARPGDFLYINVYVSGAGANFIEGPSNLVTQFTEAGEFPVANLGGSATYWGRFVAYNRSGAKSEASFTASATSQVVVAAEVLDGIITAVKLAADAVTAAKIAANAVTETAIAPGSISSPKIIAGGIEAVNIAVGAVQTDKLAAGAVVTSKLDALAVTADKIAVNAINAGHITAGSITSAKLEATLVLASRIVAGNPGGDRSEMNPTSGFEIWRGGIRIVHLNPSGDSRFEGRLIAGSASQYISMDPTLWALAPYPYPRISLQDEGAGVTCYGEIAYGSTIEGADFLHLARRVKGTDAGRGGELLLDMAPSFRFRDSSSAIRTYIRLTEEAIAFNNNNVRLEVVRSGPSLNQAKLQAPNQNSGMTFDTANIYCNNNGGGAIQITALSFNVASEAAGKDNIAPLDSPGKLVRTARAQRWNYRTNPDLEHVGPLIDDLPEWMVIRRPEHPATVSIGTVAGVAWAAGADAHDRLDALEARLANLEAA